MGLVGEEGGKGGFWCGLLGVSVVFLAPLALKAAKVDSELL